MRCKLVYLFLLTLLSGCAVKPPTDNPYYKAGASKGAHAVISALNGDDRINKANHWNPFNRGNWATELALIVAFNDEKGVTGRWGSLYVAPGSYKVVVICTGKGFGVEIVVPLENLKAGTEYGLECNGFSAARVNVQVHTKAI